jgi:aminopeptidase-like protein
MTSTQHKPNLDLNGVGREIYKLACELYPICRSITGNGLRQSLRILQQHIPLELNEVPTGTNVFDWTIPKEWNINDAYVKNAVGEKVIDFKESNLHVLNYSVPVRRKIPLTELREHIYTLPDKPDWIPYRTSYYKENWGFCARHRTLEELEDGEYEVLIDSTLEPGSLTYGEYFLKGEREEEVLISCHCCHPSLCNDNLSGMALSTFLAKILTYRDLHYSYRFLFIPGTIGSITWLSLNEDQAFRIQHGLVVTCVGDPGKLTYKRSRRGNAEIDRAAIHVLKYSGQEYEIVDFYPYGYDERQYCSPGFNLAVGSLTRTPHGRYPEYHTSADNLDLVQPEYLGDSIGKYLDVIEILENNKMYLNANPKCEPQLGKRGLYTVFGGRKGDSAFELAMLWVLNMSDGLHTLLDIAEMSSLAFPSIKEAAEVLLDHNLLIEVDE